MGGRDDAGKSARLWRMFVSTWRTSRHRRAGPLLLGSEPNCPAWQPLSGSRTCHLCTFARFWLHESLVSDLVRF